MMGWFKQDKASDMKGNSFTGLSGKTAGEAYIDKCIDSFPAAIPDDDEDDPAYEIVGAAAPMPQPCGDRCIVLPEAESDKTPGGLYKPDIAREKPTRGIVLAVGEELAGHCMKPGYEWVNESTEKAIKDMGHYIPPKLRPNDVVLYGRYSGTEFEHEGETLLIVRYPDILAVYR